MFGYSFNPRFANETSTGFQTVVVCWKETGAHKLSIKIFGKDCLFKANERSFFGYLGKRKILFFDESLRKIRFSR